MQSLYYTDDRRARMSKRQLRRFPAARRHSCPRDGGAGWQGAVLLAPEGGHQRMLNTSGPVPQWQEPWTWPLHHQRCCQREKGRRSSLLLLSSQLPAFIKASRLPSQKPASRGGVRAQRENSLREHCAPNPMTPQRAGECWTEALRNAGRDHTANHVHVYIHFCVFFSW